MQKRHAAARFNGIRHFVHGVSTEHDTFGARLLQPRCRLGQHIAGTLPFSGGLTGFNLMKINAM